MWLARGPPDRTLPDDQTVGMARSRVQRGRPCQRPISSCRDRRRARDVDV